ncbi:MAG: hypothetical protein ABWY26_08755 [Microbacterium sp.]
MSSSEPVQFCRSRNDGRRCTRELGHRGLHRHRTILWTDAGADALRCGGSGAPGVPAARLAHGFPGGRALCRTCLGFIPLDDDGRLVEHDTWTESAGREATERAEWFNAFGWSDGDEPQGAAGAPPGDARP